MQQKNDAILNEQMQLLYAALPFSIIATLINGIILVYIERSVIDHEILVVWIICLIFVTVFRAVIYMFYKLQKPWLNTTWLSANRRWNYIHGFGVLLVAIVWGSASIFLFPSQSVAHQAFLGFVIAGMSAGAISTLSNSKSGMLIFSTCLLLPLATQFLIEGGEFGLAMGGLVIFYYLLISSIAIKTYRNSFQNIKLRFHAEEQQAALKQSEEKYQAIFKSAPLGILHYTKQGEITSKNAMALDLIEMSDESLSQINLLNNVRDPEFVNAIQLSLRGELGQYKGLTSAIFSYSAKPIKMYCRGIYDASGQISGGVAILEDITEESRVDLLKNEFVSTVSHELRTPLTAIHGSIMLLKNAKSKFSEDQMNSLVNNISRNSERLIQLVNDILDIEKISTGKMDFHFEKLKLSDMLNQSVTDNQAYADKYQVTFVAQVDSQDVRLVIDKNRFQQVMANLMSNAAKFSPENSEVLVGAKIVNSNVRIFVKDKGLGIPAEFQNRIFEKFAQHDSSDTRKVGGTGLGLTISKEIVERMNGTLSFETELDVGSTFYFDFPIAD